MIFGFFVADEVTKKKDIKVWLLTIGNWPNYAGNQSQEDC
jgi:hypothetical protein